MAKLKAIYKTREEIPEEQREQYVEHALDDGSKVFKLDVEDTDGFSLQSVGAAMTELSKLREQTPRLKAFEELQVGPTKLREALSELETLRKSKGDNESETVAKLQQEIKTLKEGLDAAVGEAKAPLDSKIGKLTEQLTKLKKEDALTAAIVAAGGSEALELLLPSLGKHITVEENDDGELVAHVVDESGNKRIGTDLKPFSVGALVEEKKKLPAFAPAFAGANMSGRGTNSDGSNNSGGGENIDLDDVGKMNMDEYRKARDKGGALEHV
jgi:hypothetical protein